MMCIKDSLQKVRWWTVVKLAPVALVLWTFGFAWALSAEPPGQRKFSSAAEASRALFRAAQAGDETALLEIFGPDGKEIISSGDPVEDKDSRDQFVRKYREMNRLNRAALYRRRELADADPAREQEWCMVLRYWSRQGRNIVSADRTK